MSGVRSGRCLFAVVLLLSGITVGADDGYTEPQLYGTRPGVGGEWNIGPIGVTGIRARIYKGLKVTVEGTSPGSPADGLFKQGDVILGVNGEMLKGRNPLVVLGTALTQAEAGDGVLAFDVVKPDAKAPARVTITIPVLGAYSKTFPLDCEKSTVIIRQAAEFYAGPERLQSYNMWNALACLFLLSTGDDAYVPRVKAYLSQFLSPEGDVKGVGEHSWYNGYNGIACAEYYLRTGDATVLPILQYLCDDARDRQRYGVGWGHWGSNANPAYESGGGMQHAAGTQVLLTLVLGKMCGVEVDEKTLVGALTHWYRFAGHGAIPIADQRYWHIFRSAGRDGATAAVMHVASHAKGDVTIYERAKEYLAMSVLTSWPSRSYDWEVYWHGLSGQFMRDYDAAQYHTTMQRFHWTFDLGRAPSGGFAWAHNKGPEDPLDAGIGLALAYTAPLRTLCITGATKSKHAEPFSMPEHLWGTEADLSFLTAKHHDEFYKYGDDEEIHIPYWQLPLQLRYSPADVKDLPLDMLRKNVRHARWAIRAAAAKALCMNGHYAEIEALLRDSDPRLRRAALDGINDCRPWFTGHPVGKQALPADTYTPAMCDAIGKMLADPEEAWFVIDGALLALSHAPVAFLQEQVSAVRPWLNHGDWWLRESAFFALMGLQRSEPAFIEQLQAALHTMTREYRYNPRHKMMKELEKVLADAEPGGTVHTLIADGFARSALETRVLPDVGEYNRSREGEVNITEVVQAAISHAPGAAPRLAEAMVGAGLLSSLDSGYLMNIIKGPDGHKHDRHVGLYPALEGLPAEEKARLAGLLFDRFRPELIGRLQKEEKPSGKMIDMILELTTLKRPVEGWQPVGAPDPAEREWHYRTWDPTEKLHARINGPKRWNHSEPPDAMKDWFAVAFDAADWATGLAPVGKGTFKAFGHGRGSTARPDFSYENRADWGDGEFIAMRSTFTVTEDDLNRDFYRIRILTPCGYRLYLNGHMIHKYGWWHNVPTYNQIMLNAGQTRHLKEGTNVLAVQGIVRYEKDRATDTYYTFGQMDLYIEALGESDLEP